MTPMTPSELIQAQFDRALIEAFEMSRVPTPDRPVYDRIGWPVEDGPLAPDTELWAE